MATTPPAVVHVSGEPDLLALAQSQYLHAQEIINFADTKAQLTLAADALLASVLVGLDADLAPRLFHPSTPATQRIAVALLVLMFVALGLSVYFAVNVARPRLKVGRGTNLFFFGYITQHSEAEYISRFMHMGEHDVLSGLLSQVYARSLIAQRKMAGIKWSLDFLIIAFALWAVAQMLLLVA